MKIVFCVNFSYPSIGGCEKVIKQISEYFANTYNYECVVYSLNVKKEFSFNNVTYKSIDKKWSNSLCDIREERPDYILVYSDLFVNFKHIINNINEFDCKVGVCLVGANFLRENSNFISQVKYYVNFNKVDIITHSYSYLDSLLCIDENIKYNVIPNFVDIKEFNNCYINNFIDNYNLDLYKDKKKILCVSNFFPGKNQKELLKILNKINSDFVAIFVSSSNNISFIKRKQNEFKKEISKYDFPIILLEDISREDVVSAFHYADIFAFSSSKEVSPLVLLESQASSTPWVAFPVGNAQELTGGLIVENEFPKDINDNFIFNDIVNKRFSDAIDKLLIDDNVYDDLKNKGLNQIKQYFTMDKVMSKYKDIFESN